MSENNKKLKNSVNIAISTLMDVGGGIEEAEAVTVFGEEIFTLFSAIESGHVKHSEGRIWVLPSIAMSFALKGATA